MSKVEQLVKKFEGIINEPWPVGLSGAEKVWFLIFDPAELRKVHFKLSEFEMATKNAKRDWLMISLNNHFSKWLSQHDYKDSFFKEPEYISDALQDEFKDFIMEDISKQLKESTENTLVVLKDAAAIFGFIKLSDIVQEISKKIDGRLMVLFPGEFTNNQYRLMDARDGWDYLARPITL
jgi:hypothetical protein